MFWVHRVCVCQRCLFCNRSTSLCFWRDRCEDHHLPNLCSICQRLSARDTGASTRGERKGRARSVRSERKARGASAEARGASAEGARNAGGQWFRELTMVPSCKVVPTTVVPSSVMEYTDTVTDIRSVAQSQTKPMLTFQRNEYCRPLM